MHQLQKYGTVDKLSVSLAAHVHENQWHEEVLLLLHEKDSFLGKLVLLLLLEDPLGSGWTLLLQ
jgi:hypothetical protein